MQRNCHNTNTFRPQLIQNLRREVQTGGRGGDCANALGVDRLVPIGVFRLLLDVGRQRDLALLLQEAKDIVYIY